MPCCQSDFRLRWNFALPERGLRLRWNFALPERGFRLRWNFALPEVFALPVIGDAFRRNFALSMKKARTVGPGFLIEGSLMFVLGLLA